MSGYSDCEGARSMDVWERFWLVSGASTGWSAELFVGGVTYEAGTGGSLAAGGVRRVPHSDCLGACLTAVASLPLPHCRCLTAVASAVAALSLPPPRCLNSVAPRLSSTSPSPTDR